jgi:hypothetical protein
MPVDFETPEEVAELFNAAGGTNALAKRIGFSRQRLHNWLVNGKIPPMVVRGYKQLFRRILERTKQAA